MWQQPRRMSSSHHDCRRECALQCGNAVKEDRKTRQEAPATQLGGASWEGASAASSPGATARVRGGPTSSPLTCTLSVSRPARVARRAAA